MFASIGKDKDFQERDWLARFYAMPEAERDSYQEGDTINIIAPGPNAMSTPRPQTLAEKSLTTLKSERVEELKLQNEIDIGKGINETSDPRSIERTEIVPKIKTTTEVKGSSSPNQQKKDDYPRGQDQKNPAPGKKVEISYGERINQTALSNANRGGGAVSLLNQYFNALTFAVRMEMITRYIAEKERLESKIAAERVLVVPPKPAAVERILADFRRHGRTSANPFEKEKILKIISKLEQLRERSYAMWKEKK